MKIASNKTKKVIKLLSICTVLIFCFLPITSAFFMPAEKVNVLNIAKANKQTLTPRPSKPIGSWNGVYTPMAPLGSLFGGSINIAGEGIASYLDALFRAGIAIATGLALIMVMYGGFLYTSTDAITGKGEGKEIIKQALLGLLLALTSVLILNQLNPALLRNDVRPNEVFVPGVDGVPGGGANGGVFQGGGGSSGGTGASGDWGGGGGTTSELQPGDEGLSPTSTGFAFTTNQGRLDTDGTERPPFADPYYQSQTSVPGLNANTDIFAVVPIGSGIPLRTPVTITNLDTGVSVTGIVGDRGPTQNGHGEMSLAAARQIGVWVQGDGNTVRRANVLIEYHTR